MLELGIYGVYLHLLIVVVLAVRVIMARSAPGVALAWIVIVAFVPAAGVVFYLLFGERRVGHRRADRIAAVRAEVAPLAEQYLASGVTEVDWTRHSTASRGLDQLGRRLVGLPTVNGNHLELQSDTLETLRAISRDIDDAQHSVSMEFYIWAKGGEADTVLEAVERAARRGVACRVLVDHIGGGPWFRGSQPKRLRDAGVEVRPALQTGMLTTFTSRNDLRLHRKIVAVDGRVAWTGSMNLVDPRFFKQESGVGQWIDAMVRIEGHAVSLLSAIVMGDWMIESGGSIHELLVSVKAGDSKTAGSSDVQIIPSGPEEGDGIVQTLIALAGAANDRLILTTPYFVPDESLKRAIRGAAARGVQVDLIVPAKVDSLLVRFASRSYYADLLEAGVRVHAFRGGLLHTKAVIVDNGISMIGTVNLDMRSLWLNYEVSLVVHDSGFARRLGALVESYLDDSDLIDFDEWAQRPFWPRFAENSVRLVSPLL